jgi:hypothetical protein
MLFMETNQPTVYVTCAVCLNMHKEVAGTIARHGFHIITQGMGHGHLNARHTSSCAGRRFPIFEVSTEGTEWQLTNIRAALATAEARLEELKGHPALVHQVLPRGSYNLPKRQWKYIPITVEPGTQPGYIDGYSHPGYDYLHRHEVRKTEELVRELTEVRNHYEQVIKEWTPREVSRAG